MTELSDEKSFEMEVERCPHTASSACYGEILSEMIQQSRDQKDLLYKLILRSVKLVIRTHHPVCVCLF